MWEKQNFLTELRRLKQAISVSWTNTRAIPSTPDALQKGSIGTLYLSEEPHVVFEDCVCYTLSMRTAPERNPMAMPFCALSAMESLLANHTVFTEVIEYDADKEPMTEDASRFCVSYAQSCFASPSVDIALFLQSKNKLLTVTQGINKGLHSVLLKNPGMGKSIHCTQTGFMKNVPACVYQHQQEAENFIATTTSDIWLHYPWCHQDLLIAVPAAKECESKLIETLKEFAYHENQKLEVLFWRA